MIPEQWILIGAALLMGYIVGYAFGQGGMTAEQEEEEE